MNINFKDSYYILYDDYDNLITYYNTLIEFCITFNYSCTEIRRKFRNSSTNFINVDIDKRRYKLYIFNDFE